MSLDVGIETLRFIASQCGTCGGGGMIYGTGIDAAGDWHNSDCWDCTRLRIIVAEHDAYQEAIPFPGDR